MAKNRELSTIEHGLAEAINLIKEGNAPKIQQDESLSSYEPPCENALAHIEWFRPAKQVFDHIRGCDPQPGAYTTLRKETLSVLNVALGMRDGPAMYGEVISIEESGIRLALNGGCLLIGRIRPQGERAINANDFAKSIELKTGERFGV